MKIQPNLVALTVILFTCFGLQSCVQTRQTAQNKLTLTGSSTVAPLASEIAKRFETKHPEIHIDVQTGGSSRGLADARSKLSDIGMVSRALKGDETQEFHRFVIANDGVSIIVNRNNPVKILSNPQIVAIYKGQIRNWKQVGGKDASITVINKAEGRSTLELFLKYFSLKNSQIKADVIIGDNQQGIKTVTGNPNAIGYVSIGAGEFNMNHGIPIKLLPIAGVDASTKTVQNGSFPLSRPLLLITTQVPSGLTKEFIEFAQSKEVYETIKQQNFVPIDTKTAKQQKALPRTAKNIHP